MHKYKQPRMGEELSSSSIPFSVRATQQVSTNYICDIWDTLENLSDIEETLFCLGAAEEDDTVTIRLSSDGGSHHVGDALLLAMNNCKAPIHIEASGRVASYATFILLNCDSFEISPFCEILCHSASMGAYGKMEETKQRIDFAHKQCEKMIRYYYEGFLTEEEIDRIIHQGYEHIMDTEEFIDRFKKMVEYRQEKAEQMMEEQQDSSSPCKECSCNAE